MEVIKVNYIHVIINLKLIDRELHLDFPQFGPEVNLNNFHFIARFTNNYSFIFHLIIIIRLAIMVRYYM